LQVAPLHWGLDAAGTAALETLLLDQAEVMRPGEAVQVDPIKPTLTAPGTKRLKLKYDKPLSSFAFNFNLRRYSRDLCA